MLSTSRIALARPLLHRKLVLQRDFGARQSIEAPQDAAAMGEISGHLTPVLIPEQV